MKVFIVVLALVALVAADHHDSHEGHHDYVVKTHEDLLTYRSKCSTELNVPADHIEKYKKWEFPDDEVTHCYIKCVFEQFGFFDASHGFDVSKIHHQLVGTAGHVDHDNETHTKIEHCAAKKTEGVSACKWAYDSGMCFIHENLRLVQSSVGTH